MGILSGLWEKRGLSLTDTKQWRDYGLLRTSAAGVSFSTEGALRYTAVYAAVRVLAETLASLPLNVLEKQPNNAKRVATDFYLHDLLHNRPNDHMTSLQWRETMMSHLALWGNGYSWLDITSRGVIRGLWPLRPDRMEKIERLGNGQLLYHYRFANGTLEKYPQYRIFHLRGLSADGILGYSPITLARQAIALGIAAEEFGARFFGNDARPGIVLKHPGILDDPAHDRLTKSWNSAYEGVGKSHKAAILEEGMDLETVGIPPEDAQFLQTRKFQVGEVSRIFRVPPHLIGDLERATFSNIEHQSIDFVVHTVRPWLVRWEQAIDQQLMSKREQARYYSNFKVDGLLRGDVQSRYQAYATARQNGWMNGDEIRELEDLNPMPDGQGQIYFMPLNMVPATQAGDFTRDRLDGEPPELRMLRNGREIRQSQFDAAQKRHRLQVRFMPLFKDISGRITRRETNDIGNAAQRFLQRRTLSEFSSWLTEFYEQHASFIEGQLRPLLDTYSTQIIELAAEELALDVPVLTNFFEAYVESAGARQVARNEDRLRSVMEDNPDTLLAAIEAELEHWRETKPDQVALEESVRGGNAFAVAAYGALGVTRKLWVAIGDSCPYCDDLSGRVVGIETHFLSAGDDYQPGGADVPLRVSRNVGHAPVHRGCDCMVVSA